MAFEIKYDRDGIPIVPKEKAAAVPEQPKVVITPQETQTIQAQAQHYENQQPQEPQESDSSLAETLQAGTEENSIPAQTQPSPKKVGPQESFRALRETVERAERERDEALRYIREMQAKQQQVQQDEDDDINLAPDDVAEGKHLVKFKNKIKKLEQQLYTYQQQSTVMTTEARLKAQYPDFDKVVSKENVEQLRYAYPEIAETLNSSTDLYNKAVSAYTLIKKFGIIQQEDTYAKDRERVAQNAAKPRPLVSASPQYGDSPMSMANAFQGGLTDDLRRQLVREMQDARKNL